MQVAEFDADQERSMARQLTESATKQQSARAISMLVMGASALNGCHHVLCKNT